jgi:hypothetical protein
MIEDELILLLPREITEGRANWVRVVISHPSPPSCGSAMGGSQKSSGLSRIVNVNRQCANRDKPQLIVRL